MILVLESLLLEVLARPGLSLGLVGALALSVRGEWQLAALAVLLGQLLRALVRGFVAREVLANLLVAGLCLPWGRWGLLLYPFVSWAVPVALSPPLRTDEAVQQARRRRDMAFVGLLVPALAWLQVHDLWGVIPCLVAVQFLLRPPPQTHAANPLQAPLAEAEARYENLLATRESGALERHQLTQELAVLERLSHSLAHCPTLQASLETVLQAVEEAVPCRSCALFGAELEPLAWRSPHAERLQSAGLLGLTEPVVKAALSTPSRLEANAEQLTGERIFVGEPAAVGLGLEAGGVLYWGGSERPSEHQLNLLSVIADQASLALLAGRQRDQLVSALALGESRLASHQQWVERLILVLDGLRGLLAASDLHAEYAALVQRCLGGTGGILLEQDQVVWAWGEPVEAQVPAGLDRPLLLAERMLLPLPQEHLVMILGGSYDRDQQTLAGLLLYLFAVLHQRVRAQQQLVQASKLGAVGQLAAGVAHELNTPLGAVGLALESVRKQVASTTLTRVELALTACRQCQEIVAKLLVFVRTDEDVHSLSLNEVLAETLLVVRSTLARAKVVLTTDLGEVPPVRARRGDLQQVLTNLVMNAAHVARHITVRSWLADGWVCIRVSDDGPGMPREVLERAFEPFFTTKPVGQGTGLGLSISREVVQQLGGELLLESGVGEGTRATVRLPSTRE